MKVMKKPINVARPANNDNRKGMRILEFIRGFETGYKGIKDSDL